MLYVCMRIKNFPVLSNQALSVARCTATTASAVGSGLPVCSDVPFHRASEFGLMKELINQLCKDVNLGAAVHFILLFTLVA